MLIVSDSYTLPQLILSIFLQASNNNNNVSPPSASNSANDRPVEALVDSESDSEPEDGGRGARNDGTLLASDPPKPL